MAHSEAKKAEALVQLALCHNDFKAAAERAGVGVTTLKRWAKTENGPKKGGASKTAEILERAVVQLLEKAPEDIPPRDWAIVLGIMIDKWLLMSGHPSRRQNG